MGVGLTQLTRRVRALLIHKCYLSIYFILLFLREPIFLPAIAAILECPSDVVMLLVVLPCEIRTYNEQGNDYQQGNTTSDQITASIQRCFLF